MKTKEKILVCSRPDCEVIVERKALNFSQKATEAGYKGYDPPICISHILDALKRVKLEEIAASKEQARAEEEARREQRSFEASSISQEKADSLLTRTEVARIIGISSDGISELISVGLISQEIGRRPEKVYLSKESCANFATLVSTGKINISELEMLSSSDRKKLSQNLGKLIISLQNGAFS